MKLFLTFKGIWKVDSANFISWAVTALAITSIPGTEQWPAKKTIHGYLLRKKLVLLKRITKSTPPKEQRSAHFLEHTVHTPLAI